MDSENKNVETTKVEEKKVNKILRISIRTEGKEKADEIFKVSIDPRLADHIYTNEKKMLERAKKFCDEIVPELETLLGKLSNIK